MWRSGYIIVTSPFPHEQAPQQLEPENPLSSMPFWMVSDWHVMNKEEHLIMFDTGNIVPTSGMCGKLEWLAQSYHWWLSTACTAVVTEIGYHKKSTIDADISFLSEAEWKAELTILLTDLVAEDSNPKQSMVDLKCEAGVAWQKVSFIYSFILLIMECSTHFRSMPFTLPYCRNKSLPWLPIN